MSNSVLLEPKLDEQTDLKRLRVRLRGRVQGVGLRPCVCRWAIARGLSGWVANGTEGVDLEVEGRWDLLEDLPHQLRCVAPEAARIEEVIISDCRLEAGVGFFIKASEATGPKRTHVPPDRALCTSCRNELFDPLNRRYRYPFISCTECGPRYSIIESLPYDRARTSMRGFRCCEACATEYRDPASGRFHHQANACATCGPSVSLLDASGSTLATGTHVFPLLSSAFQHGSIVAVKGLGGFHLFTDAANAAAVARLRRIKHRNNKPFAVMFPSLESIEEHCVVSPNERDVLTSSIAPIVLLRRRCQQRFQAVALDSPILGAMLPYTPLHAVLLADCRRPLVATSGNRPDEPLCIDEHKVLRDLAGMADLYLVHDRPIARRVDDSVVRVMLDQPMRLRRARGYDSVVSTHLPHSPGILAVGGHLKNTLAIATGDAMALSPHIGDLWTTGAQCAARKTCRQLLDQSPSKVAMVAHDLHPDYASTAFANELDLPTFAVQHHVAHALACMAEHDITGSVSAIVWDGAGLGTDGTLWGGETLLLDARNWTRLAHMRRFPLPGGEQAMREPRRVALGVLYEIGRCQMLEGLDLPTLTAFSQLERKILLQALKYGINCRLTSSVGRLFDAVASFLGLVQRNDFEGYAASRVEYVSDDPMLHEPYSFVLMNILTQPKAIDWAPAIAGILKDIESHTKAAVIAARFHRTLVEMLVATAVLGDRERVILAGGCFQNAWLLKTAVLRLQEAGFQAYWPQRIPPNDGGLAVGQCYAAVLGIKAA